MRESMGFCTSPLGVMALGQHSERVVVVLLEACPALVVHC